ncbi:hypothetical protein HDG34_001495 [Paraburkholderia sp. HC6.4b]|nr:hypothetical protein [Paraburkholderia sp. HC6.4b]MBB5453680.1 hypothetical protein [Paraburkholderia sp. Kb1A]
MRTFRCLDVGMRTGPVSNVPQSICNQQMRFACWPGTDIQQAATGSLRTCVGKSQTPLQSARYPRGLLRSGHFGPFLQGMRTTFVLPTHDWHEPCKKHPQLVAGLP